MCLYLGIYILSIKKIQKILIQKDAKLICKRNRLFIKDIIMYLNRDNSKIYLNLMRTYKLLRAIMTNKIGVVK